jgi:hypothetical protein
MKYTSFFFDRIQVIPIPAGFRKAWDCKVHVSQLINGIIWWSARPSG